MARLVPAFEQFFDASGEPLAYGKLFFYETGSSTTLKDTFADISEITKNTNPVILNGDGRCPDVFGTGSYRVALTDKDSVQLVQRDPVGGSGSQEFGADWVSGITYETGDITRDGQYYYQGQTNNNRGNKPATDGGTNWVTWPPNTQDAEIFRDEAEVFRDEAALSAIASSASETNAAASEANAAASESNAAASEANAAASELAASTSAGEAEQSAIDAANSAASSGKDFSATSTTSLTIGLGAKSLTIEAGKGFVVSQLVNISFDVDNFMVGPVTSYSDTTGLLEVDVSESVGSGSYSAWGISPKVDSLSVSLPVSGSVSAGAPVIVDASGDAIQVSGLPMSAGAPSVFEAASSDNAVAAYDPINNKIVIAYTDDANATRATAVVGAISGDSISYGTPVVFDAGSFTDDFDISYNPIENKFVIVYDQAGSGKGVVGTVSGTSISFGSPTTYGTASYSQVVFDSGSSQSVVFFRDGSADLKGSVATITGTSISFGSLQGPSTDNVDYIVAESDTSSGKVVVVHRNTSQANRIDSYVADVTGSTISYSAVSTISGTTDIPRGIAFDQSSGAMLYVNNQEAYIGTITGSTIAFGGSFPFSASSSFSAVGSAPELGNLLVVYYDTSMLVGRAITATISIAGSVSFSDPVTISSGQISSDPGGIAFDPTTNQYAYAFEDFSNSNYGSAVTVFPESTNLQSGSFFGFSVNAYSDGDTGEFNSIGSVNNGQSLLSTSKKYYVNMDGSLGEDENQYYAGIALSPTKILVKG